MKYNGGKNSTWRHIVNECPPHDVKIEACFGSGPLTRFMRPARMNYGIELDPAVVAAVTPQVALRSGSFKLLQGDILHLLDPESALMLEVRRFERALIYIDPPYLMVDETGDAVRISQADLYRDELKTVQGHTALLRLVRSLRCQVILSGYSSRLYERLLHDWRRVTFTAYDRQNRARTECLWCNFDKPEKLHDYRFIGTGHRQRWNLTKRERRLAAKLKKMPVLERFRLFETLRASLEDGENLVAPGAANGVARGAPELASSAENAVSGGVSSK